jgi:hypothetical protein
MSGCRCHPRGRLAIAEIRRPPHNFFDLDLILGLADITMQKELPVKLRGTVAHESREQQWQFGTEDFREGVAAMAERRRPKFHGK